MKEVEQYISQFEPEIQARLEILRQIFFEVLPDTEESIRYKMPAFKVGKHHLYFTAYKKHIGFYPVYGLPEIEEEVSKYRAKKNKRQPTFYARQTIANRIGKENYNVEIKTLIKMSEKIINLNIEVTALLDALNHPFRNEIEQLRICILETNKHLEENIKWNGPNYCFNNEDRITMRVQPPRKQIQLIFHRGAKKQTQPKDELISNKSKMLVWKENDRAIVTFKSLQDIEGGKTDLTKIINEWIEVTK